MDYVPAEAGVLVPDGLKRMWHDCARSRSAMARIC